MYLLINSANQVTQSELLLYLSLSAASFVWKPAVPPSMVFCFGLTSPMLFKFFLWNSSLESLDYTRNVFVDWDLNRSYPNAGQFFTIFSLAT